MKNISGGESSLGKIIEKRAPNSHVESRVLDGTGDATVTKLLDDQDLHVDIQVIADDEVE